MQLFAQLSLPLKEVKETLCLTHTKALMQRAAGELEGCQGPSEPVQGAHPMTHSWQLPARIPASNPHNYPLRWSLLLTPLHCEGN